MYKTLNHLCGNRWENSDVKTEIKALKKFKELKYELEEKRGWGMNPRGLL